MNITIISLLFEICKVENSLQISKGGHKARPYSIYFNISNISVLLLTPTAWLISFPFWITTKVGMLMI